MFDSILGMIHECLCGITPFSQGKKQAQCIRFSTSHSHWQSWTLFESGSVSPRKFMQIHHSYYEALNDWFDRVSTFFLILCICLNSLAPSCAGCLFVLPDLFSVLLHYALCLADWPLMTTSSGIHIPSFLSVLILYWMLQLLSGGPLLAVLSGFQQFFPPLTLWALGE